MQGRVGRLEEHPQVSCIDVGDTALREYIRRREYALRARLVREKSFDEVIDGAQGPFAHGGDRIAQNVVLHWAMIPEPRPSGAPRRSRSACGLKELRHIR